MNCEFCSSVGHIWFDCPKKPDGWKPDRLKKSNTAEVRVSTPKSGRQRGKEQRDDLAPPVSVDDRPAKPDAAETVGRTKPKKQRTMARADYANRLPIEKRTDELVVVANKRGRPRIHADRKAYKAQKEREYRAKLKAQKGTT